MAILCPVCAKEVGARAQNPAFPFCSARCKMVDLGKWLNEEYRMPASESDEDPEGDAAKKDGDGEA